MPFPNNFKGNEKSPTINGEISRISPTILGQKVTFTICELFGLILKFFCEKVKLDVFFNVILTSLEEKFYILSYAYFLELTG